MMWLVNIQRNLSWPCLEPAGGWSGCSLCLPPRLPHGTVFAEPHMELVHMPGAPAADAFNDVAESMDAEPAWLRQQPLT